ncbi:response regulator transcription factor [bacterium]|nr:response regulator transcription factor [bacterium]
MTLTKIKTIIVDDEALARRRIKKLLAARADVDVVAECNNGNDAIASIESLKPDLVFLDIQMPEIGGFELIERLDVKNFPVIIFVTAHDSYALKAFDINAVDYILKPFDDERFYHALDRACELIEQKETGAWAKRVFKMLNGLQQEPGAAASSNSNYLDRIVIRTSGRIHFASTDAIDWIEASGKHLDIHAGKSVHRIRESMSDLERKLDPKKFLRIHRSYIINISRIREMQSWHKGEYMVILENDTKLVTGRGYRDNLNLLLNRLV